MRQNLSADSCKCNPYRNETVTTVLGKPRKKDVLHESKIKPYYQSMENIVRCNVLKIMFARWTTPHFIYYADDAVDWSNARTDSFGSSLLFKHKTINCWIIYVYWLHRSQKICRTEIIIIRHSLKRLKILVDYISITRKQSTYLPSSDQIFYT